MSDVTETTAIAKSLGIKLTNANEGTDLYEAWADRVWQAWVCLEEGAIQAYRQARDQADQYAI